MAVLLSIAELEEIHKDRDRLHEEIRKIRDTRGDDRCWQDFEKLYALLPEGYTPPIRDETVELELCKQFIRSCHDPKVTYVSPQRRIEELESLVGDAIDTVEAVTYSEPNPALKALIRRLKEEV